MIVRHTVACSTCNHPITLRIQVGHRPYQEHTFQCPECGEDMIVGMDCDAETASVRIREIDNVTPGNEEGTVVNLSPEFTIAEEDLHRDLVFPSGQHIHALIDAQQRLGFDPYAASMEHVCSQVSNFKNFDENWAIIKKGWSLTMKGRIDLAESQLQKYVSPGFHESYELNFVLFDFCCRFLIPGQYHLFDRASGLTAQIAKHHPMEYERFLDHYVTEMHGDNLARYFDIFSQYFTCYDDFGQTLIFAQHDMELPSDHHATSTSFAKTKLFYGNAFEALTSNIAVLACLNNINQNRSYDQFQSMDLAKYLTINKANRSNPFKDTSEFAAITNPLDSTLRNASHHGSMRLLHGGRRIEFRSGGTGARQKITYREYIEKCNEIMISCCALLALELGIAY